MNLRPPFVDRDVIADSLTLANALKLNDQELPELTAMFGLSATCARRWRNWPTRFGLVLVALTRGDRGGLLLAGGDWSDHPGRARRGERHHRGR